MRFLVDAQLPPALARMLSAKGFEAEHVYDVQLGTAQDSAIWDYALSAQAAIITKDEDFATRITLRPEGPPIVWVRIGIPANARWLIGSTHCFLLLSPIWKTARN
jgi:predicted nuclease of predicted toxin-antitoxin system